MPTGFYKRTKENFKVPVNSGKTRFKKGMIPWNKGKSSSYMIGNKNAVIHGLSHTVEYRRAMRHKRGGKASIKIIQMVYEDNIKKYGTLTCYLCLNPIEFSKDHLEHKTPLSKGGTNNYENLSVACEKCNRRKFTKTEEEFRRELSNDR